jgi:outer membrane lipoprotein SlyB
MKPMPTTSIPAVADPMLSPAMLSARGWMSVPRTAAAMLATALCVGACAGADYRPVVDMQGHTEVAYDRDVAECQQMARTARDNTSEAEGAGVGAAAGGAGGALLGAIGGDPLLGAGVGALAGLVGTGGYEEVKTENREETIVRNCMRSRGYSILG